MNSFPPPKEGGCEVNIDIEVSFKVRVSHAPTPPPPTRPILVVLLNRIVSHPCVVMILREIMQGS